MLKLENKGLRQMLTLPLFSCASYHTATVFFNLSLIGWVESSPQGSAAPPVPLSALPLPLPINDLPLVSTSNVLQNT
jgi:hypothetical protein